MTQGALLADRHWAQQAGQRDTLAQARQIVAQLDTLVLAAPRSSTGSDPLAWAITVLNTGPQDKVFRMSKRRLDTLGATKIEEWLWNAGAKEFVYARALKPLEGWAVEVRIQRPFRGFLGTGSQWLSDLVAGTFACLIFFALYPWLGRRLGIFNWDPTREIVASHLPTAQNSLGVATAQLQELQRTLVAIAARGNLTATEQQKVGALLSALDSASTHARTTIADTLKKAS